MSIKNGHLGTSICYILRESSTSSPYSSPSWTATLKMPKGVSRTERTPRYHFFPPDENPLSPKIQGHPSFCFSKRGFLYSGSSATFNKKQTTLMKKPLRLRPFPVQSFIKTHSHMVKYGCAKETCNE